MSARMTFTAMTEAFSVFVPGHPAPQGSKRHVGRGIMVESSKRVKPWRDDIRAALIDADGQPKARFDGAVDVQIRFYMPRPKSMRHRTSPHTKRPDIDKLVRAILDAVTSSGVIRDDSVVTGIDATKVYAETTEIPGAQITVVDAPA